MKYQTINGKCYEITFTTQVKRKDGSIQKPSKGKKAIPLKNRTDPCNCKNNPKQPAS